MQKKKSILSTSGAELWALLACALLLGPLATGWSANLFRVSSAAALGFLVLESCSCPYSCSCIPTSCSWILAVQGLVDQVNCSWC
jgi:membrane associated rhomboid family serine protease